MTEQYRVVVIGGGVVGCSVLYHLTKLGWSDVLLLERSELTSGSTWHAAGGFHTLNGDTNMAALQGYTIKLYQELEEISGMSCGLHHVGGITLADTQERFDMLKAERAKHRYMGLETEILSPAEISERAELVNVEGILGGLYDPLDGHLDPSGTTHAYARAARLAGAEIRTQSRVLETHPRSDGSWDVVTEAGMIRAEHVVNAAGLWAREVAAMAGVYLPLLPMAHQYLVTEDIPEIYQRDTEFPHVMDPGGESYLRQEGRGLCIGFYEQKCEPWAVDGTPWDFGHELLNDHFEKIEDSVAFAFKRYPVLGRAGIKRVIHGPFTFSPDGNPLVGPVPGLRNYWAACAVMAGFSQGGGVGLSLAQWMVEGEAERDIFAMDVARFGSWTDPDYTRKKVVETYQRRFSVAYPNEELPVARPRRTSPMYEIWNEMGAVWGEQFGLEVVNFFAPAGAPRVETPTFRRSNAWDAVRAEVYAVRTAAGINELQNFGKFHVTGPEARGWLDKLLAGRIPPPGRVALAPMLSPRGRLLGDFSVSCMRENDFLLIASYSAQTVHQRWFEAHADSGVQLENVSDRLTGFQVAGPASREIVALAANNQGDVRGLGFFELLEAKFGDIDTLVQRLSYTGDMGFEIYCSQNDQIALWEQLHHAGLFYAMRPFGMRAMMSLRLDRSFGAWGREYSPDYTALETGLSRFVPLSGKGDFIGRVAFEREKAVGPMRKLSAFRVDAKDADVVGYEPVWIDDTVQGFCTSGGYSHWSDTSVAFAFVPFEHVNPDLQIHIEILGELCSASLLTKPLFSLR